MKKYPPPAYCREHHRFMRYDRGQFPRRWFFCPGCGFHWRECGESLGVIVLRPAFVQR